MYQNINYITGSDETHPCSSFVSLVGRFIKKFSICINIHYYYHTFPRRDSSAEARLISRNCVSSREIQPRFAHYHSTRSLKNVAYLQLAKENEPIERARQANMDALTRITRRKIRGEVNGNSLFKLLLVERPIVNFRIPYSSGFASGAKWIYEYERAIHYGRV